MNPLQRLFYIIVFVKIYANIFVHGRTVMSTKIEYGIQILTLLIKMRMEREIATMVSFHQNQNDNENENQRKEPKNLNDRPQTTERPPTPETPDFPEIPEVAEDSQCMRADTPSSDSSISGSSTSGIGSMASSEEGTQEEDCSGDQAEIPDETGEVLQKLEEEVQAEIEQQQEVEQQLEMEQQKESDELIPIPVIMHQDRDILDLFANIAPFNMFQPSDMPSFTMSTYWEGRSVYHRLGPFGTLEEFEYEKCFHCEFRKTLPKSTVHFDQ